MEFDDYEENKSLDNNSNNKRKKRKSRSRSSSTSIKHRNNIKKHHSRGINGHYTIEYKLNKILSGESPRPRNPPTLTVILNIDQTYFAYLLLFLY